MFVMCGHLASGKSTFARTFAKLNNYLYLSIDDTYAEFEDGYNHKFDAWISFFKKIHQAELEHCNVIIDVNANTRADREDYLNWFPNFEHHLIWIDTSTENCLINNFYRDRVIDPNYMLESFERFEPFKYDEWSYHSGRRAEWYSVSRIINKNNKFEFIEELYGDTPAEVIKAFNNRSTI